MYKELADSEKARIDAERRVESTASVLETHLRENVKAERDKIQHEYDLMKQRFEAEVSCCTRLFTRFLSINQIYDLRDEITRLEQQGHRKEDALKREIKDYQDVRTMTTCYNPMLIDFVPALVGRRGA